MSDQEHGRHAISLGAGTLTSVIVDCALYRDGKRTEETRNLLRLAAEARRDPSAFVWMGLKEPTENDLLGVSRIFGLHPLAVEDAIRAHQRPKVEAYPGHLFVVLRTLTYHDDTSQVETGEVAVFIGKDFVITVRHGEGQELHSLRDQLESRPDRLSQGPAVGPARSRRRGGGHLRRAWLTRCSSTSTRSSRASSATTCSTTHR